MAQVFRIREDVNQFASVVTDDASLFLEFDGRKKEEWVAPELIQFNQREPRANFMYLVAGALCFDDIALQVMGDIFEMAGQILPARLQGDDVYILNVTEVCPALDPDASDWRISARTGERVSVAKPAFRWDMFSVSTVFKVAETCRAELYALAGVTDKDDEFLGRYEERGLTGLEFELLDENG